MHVSCNGCKLKIEENNNKKMLNTRYWRADQNVFGLEYTPTES